MSSQSSLCYLRSLHVRRRCATAVFALLITACSQGPATPDAANDGAANADSADGADRTDGGSNVDGASDARADATLQDAADVTSPSDSGADSAQSDASMDARTDASDASADAMADSGGGDAAVLHPRWLASVEQEGPRPALYIQRPDGTERRRLRFDRVTNTIPENDDPVLNVSDDRIIAMPFMTFSPNGAYLAVVLSVAHDESQIVVLDVAAGTGRVASLNMQYIMGPPAWSADSNTLAYAMNVGLPITARLELFTTTLSTLAVHRVTNTGGIPNIGNGVGLRTRIASDGALLFGVTDGEGPAPLFDRLTGIRRSLLDGTLSNLERSMTGMAFEAARNSTHVLVARRLAVAPDGSIDAQLVLRNMTTMTERVLLPHGPIADAQFDSNDTYAKALTDRYDVGSDTHGYEWHVINVASGATESFVVPRAASAAIRTELYIGP